MGENDCKSKFYENSVILIKNVYDSTSGFYEVWIKCRYYCFCRLKALSIEPYTIEEAERAAGMGSYKRPEKVTVETQSASMETDNT